MRRARRLLLALCVLGALLVLGSAAASAETYTRIEGTRVSLRVPDGFFVSDEFPGLGREADLSYKYLGHVAEAEEARTRTIYGAILLFFFAGVGVSRLRRWTPADPVP